MNLGSGNIHLACTLYKLYVFGDGISMSAIQYEYFQPVLGHHIIGNCIKQNQKTQYKYRIRDMEKHSLSICKYLHFIWIVLFSFE